MIKDNMYIMKLIYSISPKRVVLSGISILFGYLNWVFYSGVFIKYVIEGLESGKSYAQLMVFVGITVVVSFIISMIDHYYVNVTTPLTDTLIYNKLYERLYKTGTSRFRGSGTGSRSERFKIGSISLSLIIYFAITYIKIRRDHKLTII